MRTHAAQRAVKEFRYARTKHTTHHTHPERTVPHNVPPHTKQDKITFYLILMVFRYMQTANYTGRVFSYKSAHLLLEVYNNIKKNIRNLLLKRIVYVHVHMCVGRVCVRCLHPRIRLASARACCCLADPYLGQFFLIIIFFTIKCNNHIIVI